MLTKKQVTNIRSEVTAGDNSLPLVFQALGDAGRFRMFRLLMERNDICVTDIANVVGITVSATSQQLRVLERLGLIVKKRMGQKVCYEINNKDLITRQLVGLLRKSK